MKTLYSKHKGGDVILEVNWNCCTNKASMTFTKLKWTVLIQPKSEEYVDKLISGSEILKW